MAAYLNGGAIDDGAEAELLLGLPELGDEASHHVVPFEGGAVIDLGPGSENERVLVGKRYPDVSCRNIAENGSHSRHTRFPLGPSRRIAKNER